MNRQFTIVNLISKLIAAGLKSGAYRFLNITLTTGVDSGAAFTGGAGDDTFNAVTAGAFGAFDSIDGGAGSNTLNYTDTAAITSFGGAKIANIQTVNVTSSAGAVGAIAAPAGTAVTSSASQTLTITPVVTTGVTTAVKVYINGNLYSGTAGGTLASDINTEVARIINTVLPPLSGTSTAAAVVGSGVVTVTSPIAGTPLPSISATAGTKSQTVTAGDANAIVTAPSATKQVVSFSTAFASGQTAYLATDTYTATYDGVSVTVFPGTTGTNATAASAIAAAINSVAGATVATAAGSTVVVTAPVAGTPLPLIKVTAGGASTQAAVSAIALSTANVAVATPAVSTATLAAPTGTTKYVVSAAGVASASGAATTDITATGTEVLTSGGLNVTITASDTVVSTGAKGAVVITGSATPSTKYNLALGEKSGNTNNVAGVGVTGGTTVTINEVGGVKSSTGGITSTSAHATVVGVNPANVTNSTNGAVPVTGSTVGATAIGGLSSAPTGDVSISNVTPFTDAKGLKDVIYAAGNVKVWTNGATTVTVKGSNAATVTDIQTTLTTTNSNLTAAAGTSKLATVNLAGITGDSTITSDAITTVSVVDSARAANVNVTIAGSSAVTSNTGALNLTVGNSGSGSTRLTITDNTATSVNISSKASDYTAVNGLSNNTGDASMITLATPKATAITMTNAHKVDLGDLTAAGYGKVASVTATGATGAVVATVGDTSVQGLALATGSGKDVITIKSGANLSPNATSAATTTISLGAGDDQLLNGSSSVHTMTGVVIDGGADNDLLAASLINAGNVAKFTNFEVLGLDLTGGAATDVSLMTTATSLQLLASGGVYSNVATTQALNVTKDVSAATTTLTFPTAASTATTDSYTINFAGTQSLADVDGTAAGTYTAGSADAKVIDVTTIENVTLVSGGTGTMNNAITLIDKSATQGARTLTITGDQALTVAFDSTGKFGLAAASSTSSNGVSSIDASAMTGALTINTANVETAYAGITVKGGSGNDAITLASQSAISGTLMAGYKVNAGAGDDTITTSTVSSELTGGAGKDKFVVTAAKASAAAATNAVVTTIVDAESGDTLQLLNANTTNTFNSTAVDVGSAVSLAGAIATAATASSKATTVNTINWFVYGPNTYVVEYVGTGSATTDITTTDIVVKLAGVHDLSASTLTAGNLLSLS